MQLSPEQIAEDEGAYAEAFAEDMQAGAEPTEDEAFGIEPEQQPAQEGEAAAQPAPTEAVATDEVAAGATDDPTVVEGEARPETADDQAVRAEGDDAEDLATDRTVAVVFTPEEADKERQRLKSWEGRLKKLEEELKSQADTRAAGKPEAAAAAGTNTESTTADAIAETAASADAAGKPELAEAAQEVAEQVASGEITPEQAMRQLSEDFGEDFVKLIEAVARASAGKVAGQIADERVGAVKGEIGAIKGELGKAVEDIVADIKDSKARAHFGQIAAAHPDFREIGKSAEFKAYIDGMPEAQKAEAVRVAKNGSAQEIVKLLSDFKESGKDDGSPDPTPDPVIDEQAAAAEGVRSSGMKLPEQPKPAADSYEDAWREFA
jgi:hypothetical protein